MSKPSSSEGNTANGGHAPAFAYRDAPTRMITTGDVTFAYRELGPTGGVPVVLFVHLAATLDNWDPRVIDPIAKANHVIAFDNRGVGASNGEVPATIVEMAAAGHADPVRSQGVPLLQPQCRREDRGPCVHRTASGAHHRPRCAGLNQGVPATVGGDQAMGAVGTRRPVGDHAADPDRQRRQ